mmetsp:Transcript_43429/g.101442  ORF Transcript_43429/g.101442 Transcript_43429/m.101442 type:complete len:91 (+) Transcript_43429:1591-1863(+)
MTRHFSAIQDTCRFMFGSSVEDAIGGKGSRSGESLRSNPLLGLSFFVFASPELTALGDRGTTMSWEELESAWLTGELAMYRISKAWGLLL